LTRYEIAVRAAGGNEDVMANYLPVMLDQSANNWLLSLRQDSIGSWDGLKREFTANYSATCEQLATKYDLEKVYQTPGDLLRDFIRHFSETRNSIPNVTDAEAITAFTKGLRHEQLRAKLFRKRPGTIAELISMSNGYTDAEEAE
jgi:hypothetical protein